MSVPSAVQSKAIPKNEIIRRSANYHPSIWRDYFLNYSSQSLVEYVHPSLRIISSDTVKNLYYSSRVCVCVFIYSMYYSLSLSFNFPTYNSLLGKSYLQCRCSLYFTKFSMHVYG